MFQSQQLGLGTQWKEIKTAYIQANKLCGDIVKVTPSSKVVGDFAQFMVANKLSAKDVEERADKLDFPSSVIEYFQGYLGTPPGGFPEELRSKIIRDKKRIDGRPGASMEPIDFAQVKKDLTAKYGRSMSATDAISYVMYPKVFEEFQSFLDQYGDLSNLPTRYFLGKAHPGEELHAYIDRGKLLIVKLLAVGALNTNNGTREVFFELNAEPRALTIEDRSAAVETITRPKASSDPGSVGSPLAGVVVEIEPRRVNRSKRVIRCSS